MSTLAFPALTSAEVAEDPHAFYRRLRDEAPVHYDEAIDAYLLSRFDDVELAYKNPVFTTRAYEWLVEPIHGPTILQLDGQAHTKRRRILTPSLHGKGLQELRPMLERRAAEVIETVVARNAGALLDELDGAHEADLVADFANHYPVNVIADLLGLPARDHDLFRRWYTSIVAALSNFGHDATQLADSLATKQEIEDYFLPLIRARRDAPGDDLISKLAVAELAGDRMSDLEIKAYVSLLLIAGAETTDKAFASLFRNLLEHPTQLEDVRRDRALVTSAIAETLRHSPPTQINLRETAEEVALEGGTIPQGATVVLLIGSANRDPRRFERPDEFDIHRTDLDMSRAFTAGGDYVAFGGGRHFCLGAQLAKVELETGANLVLDRFPGLRLADGFVARDVGVKMRCPPELRVRL